MVTDEASDNKRRKIFAVGAITFFSIFIIGTYIISLSTFVVPQEASAYVPPFFENKKPVAVAGSDQTIFVGHTLYFDGNESRDPDGYIIDYIWNFGDYSPNGNKAHESHVYMKAGIYTVTLMVSDNKGAFSSDKLVVTVLEPHNYAKKGIDVRVEPNRTDYFVDALEKTNTTLKINSIKTITVSIIPYSENPHVETPLPENCLVEIVDIVFSDPEAVIWPIYVERGYSDNEIIGLDESKLGIYYFMNGSWNKCRETGVDVERNIVWANMYKDEATGSLTLLGEIPRPAEFTVTQLELNPLKVEPSEIVTALIVVKNIGDESGNFNLTINVNDETDYKILELEGAERQEVFFDIKRETEGVYTVEAGGLSKKFVVELLTPNFSVTALDVDPVEVKVGEDVKVQVDIENIGDKDGTYTAILKIDDDPFDSKNVTISKGGSDVIDFTVSFERVGEHKVSVESISKTITVIPLELARFRVSTFTVNPLEIEPGENVTVTVTIANDGEETGDYDVYLKLDDDDQHDFNQVSSLAGGESETVEFTITSEDEGPHTVSVDDKSETFTVARIRKPFPWFWVIDAVMIVAIVAVVYYLRMRGII